MLHVVRGDGTTFRAPPSKVGVEGELYTRIDPSGMKDRDIERWFSHEIETPFADALTRILSLDGIERQLFPGRGDPVKRKEVQELGFIVGGLVTVWFRSLVFHYATLASKAKGLMPPRYEWRRRAL
jgi:hypothetical protein